jgi:transposase
MPGAYSADLRERVLLMGARGRLRRAKIAALVQVAASTVYRGLQAWRREGRRAAKPHAGAAAGRGGAGEAGAHRRRDQRAEPG